MKEQQSATMPVNDNLYQWIIDSTDDAIFSNDLNGIVTSWNKAAEKIFGYSAEEIISKHISILFPTHLLFEEQKFVTIALQNGVIEKLETDRVRKDGTIIRVRISVSPIKNEDEKVIGLSKIVHRLCDTQKIEKELEESESKFKNLFNLSPVPMWVIELPTLKFLAVNEKAIEHYGYTRDEFLSMTAYDIRHEEDKVKLSLLDRSDPNRVFKQEVWKHVKKDGSTIIVEISAHSVTNAGKNARMVLSIDVTEKKEAEKKIRDLNRELNNSESRYSSIIKNSKLAIILSTDTEKIIEVNQAAVDLFGYSPDEFNQISKSSLFNLYGEKLEVFLSSKMVSKNITQELLAIKKDGTQFYCEASTAFLSNADGDKLNSCIVADISERKRVEESLQKERELLDHAEDIVIMGSVDIDVETGEIVWSDGFYKLLGYQPGEIKPDNSIFLNQLLPEYKESYLNWHCGLIKKKQARGKIEIKLNRKDGEQRTFAATGLSYFSENGEVQKLIGVVQDITDLKQIEISNKLNEQRYAALFQGASDAIFIAEVETKKIVDVNEQGASLIGYSKDEIIGNTIYFIHPKDEIEAVSEIFKQFTQPKINIQNAECNVLHKSNQKIPVEISAGQVFMVDGKKYSAAYFKDLSLIKETEKKLERFGDLLNRAEDLVEIGSAEIDLKTEERVWSNGFFKILGLNPNSVTPSKSLFITFIHPDDKERYVNWYMNTTATSSSIEIKIIRTDGETRSLVISAKKYSNANNEFTSCISVIKDITEKKTLENELIKSHNQLVNLTTMIPIAILEMETNILNRTSRLTFASKGLNHIYKGLNTNDIVLLPELLLDWIIEEDKESVIKIFQIGLQNLIDFTIEFRIRNVLNEIVWVKLFYHPEKSNSEKIIWYGYLQDITKEKQILFDLEQQNNQLKDIAWMQSHVVRAPLARLMGLVDLLKNNMIGKEDEQEFLSYITESANELDDIIKGITKISSTIKHA